MTDPAVAQLTQLLNETGQPDNPLRPHQAQSYREERDRLRQIVTAPAYVTGADRGLANKRFREVDKMLRDQAARPIEDTGRRDQVHKLAKTVLRDVIRPSMVPVEVMRRNPPGAVDAFIAQENSPAMKQAVRAWKRAQWALEPEADLPNHSNLEKFRPNLAGAPGWASTFMADAQLPGVFAMTAQAKQNWPLAEPENTPLAQARKRDARSAGVKQQRQSELGANPAHRKAWGQKMAQIRATKKAAREAASPPPPPSPEPAA